MSGQQKRFFGYLALYKSISAVLQASTNADTTVKDVYTVKLGQKIETVKFSLRLPLSRHIAQLATFSINYGILVGLYASTHHPYTTLVTGE